MLLGALVRVERLKLSASRSQTARSISWTTPGYSVLSYYTTLRAKIKVFPVCGQSCGQSRFSAWFRDPPKPRKHLWRKAFRASAVVTADGAVGTPKASALPTALHPDIWFLSVSWLLPSGFCRLDRQSFCSIIYENRFFKSYSEVQCESIVGITMMCDK